MTMTVGELVERLEEYDEDTIVRTFEDGVLVDPYIEEINGQVVL